MQSTAGNIYLETEVLTATPVKLQLMLIEAAIRFGRQAGTLWEQGEDEAAGEALLRMQKIVGELIAGLNAEKEPELVHKVASVYLFIFRTLTAAHLHRDAEKLNDALRVLEVERDTWRQVSRQMEDQQPSSISGAALATGKDDQSPSGGSTENRSPSPSPTAAPAETPSSFNMEA